MTFGESNIHFMDQTKTPKKKRHEMKPMWQIVPIGGYHPPPAPTREAATKGIIKFWKLFRNREGKQDLPERNKEQLQQISQPMLSKIVPKIDWQPGAEALDRILKDKLEQHHQHSFVQFFIGPPYGGHVDILRMWAAMRRASIIEPPTTEQILNKDESWLEKIAHYNQPWVLPNLESSYLRHSEGLHLIRRFLELAFSGHFGFGVIGCESWAWSFLQKVWTGPTSDLLALQAFDSEQISLIFREMFNLSTIDPYSFRESVTGKEILSTIPETNEEISSTSPFLEKLASHTRGILGISWYYWKMSLYAESDEARDSDSDSVSDNQSSSQNTIWVRDILEETAIPSASTYETAFILHYLLLHGHLSIDLLLRLLPLSQGVITATLLKLETAGIVELVDNAWRVSALGYPSARHFLKSNGYLLDQF